MKNADVLLGQLIKQQQTAPNDLPFLEAHLQLTQNFPGLYGDWQRRFPFSQSGTKLTDIFLSSQSTKTFPEFCASFWHLVLGQAPHEGQETLMDAPSLHVHHYRPTCLNPRGPHPRDMSGETLKVEELAQKMEELVGNADQSRPVLIHTSTGDDLYDHTYGALWLGATLPLDFSKLD